MLKRRKVFTQSILIEPIEGGPVIEAGFEGAPCVLDVILASGVAIDHSCGGMGTCGTCRIEVIDGSESLRSRNEIEKEMSEIRGYKDHERLACQTDANNKMKVRIP